MMATIPVFMALVRDPVPEDATAHASAGACARWSGLGGVAVLVSHSVSFGDAPIDTVGAVALIVAAISWSVASALTRKLPLAVRQRP